MPRFTVYEASNASSSPRVALQPDLQHHCPALVLHNNVFWSVISITNCQMLRLHAQPAVKVSLAFSQLYKSASFRNLSSLNFSIISSFSGLRELQIGWSDHIFHTHFVSSDLFCVWTHNNNKFSFSDYNMRIRGELCEGVGGGDSATNFLCEALNWFHMSWSAFGRFSDQIKQRSWKKEHGCTDV